jgi:hypothetical protein
MSVEIVWGLESLHKHVVDNQMVGDRRRRWRGVGGFPRVGERKVDERCGKSRKEEARKLFKR